MRIVFASDHAGFKLKQALVLFVKELGYEVEDCGADKYEEGDDYPDFVAIAARKVSEDPENLKGIILGGSGQGEAMVANRFKQVRAVVFYGGDEEIISLSRRHNNANILSLGARFVKEDEAKRAVRDWLETTFSEDERHIRRIEKIDSF